MRLEEVNNGQILRVFSSAWKLDLTLNYGDRDRNF